MEEVELIRNAGLLIDHYVGEYEKKYRTEPIIARNGSDFTFCKDLIRWFGIEHCKGLISQFLNSPNEWFKKKAHAIDVLRTNLNVVNAELAAKRERPVQSHKGVTVVRWMCCDHCHQYASITSPLDESIDAKKLCDSCKLF